MSDRYQNFIKIYGAAATADAGGEFILPDNLPDVKRILHVMTNVRKTGAFSDASTLTCEGEVDFGVIYTGDDSAMHSVRYNARFSARSPFREADGGYNVIALPRTPETSARLSNPRKLSLKCRIPVEFSVYGIENCEPYIEGVEDESIQYFNVNDTSDTVTEITESSVPVSEDMNIPPSYPEPEELTAVYVMPGITAAVPGDGIINIKFDADVIVIYRDADKAVRMYPTVIHVSHQQNAEQAAPDSVCECFVSVYDVRYELAADQSGEMRVVELDLVYDTDTVCRTPSKGTYTADMYSTEKESAAVYKQIEITHALPAYTANFSVGGESQGTLRGDVVFATAECDNAHIVKEGGCFCEGEIGVYAVTVSGGDYENTGFTFPFRVPVALKNAENAENIETVCSVGLPSVRNSQDKIRADAELYLSVYPETKKTADAAASLKITDVPVMKRQSSLVLYRPGKGETRWQTAKKFKVPLSKLNEANTADSKILIIPG